MKKITPFKNTYYKRLIDLVESDYYPCKKCGSPVYSGYCCSYCGDTNPNQS